MEYKEIKGEQMADIRKDQQEELEELSLEELQKKIKKDKLQTGDLFLDAATGDAVVVVDVCVNENGEKAFLLGKGGKPAKQFHLLTNPAHEENPWYYESELQYPFVTSEGEFKKGSLRHPTYLD